MQNTWVYLEGDLINDETGVVQSFPIDISYYQGVEEGESWTEGGQQDSAYTSSMPARKIRAAVGGTVGEMAAAGGRDSQGRTERYARVQSVAGVDSVVDWTNRDGIYHISFEHKRWSESMFSSSGEMIVMMTTDFTPRRKGSKDDKVRSLLCLLCAFA